MYPGTCNGITQNIKRTTNMVSVCKLGWWLCHVDGSVTWMALSRGWLYHVDGSVTWMALSRGRLCHEAYWFFLSFFFLVCASPREVTYSNHMMLGMVLQSLEEGKQSTSYLTNHGGGPPTISCLGECESIFHSKNYITPFFALLGIQLPVLYSIL